MDIQPPGHQATVRPEAVAATSRPTLLEQLQPGQVVLARVERLLANNEVELRIGNQVLRATTPIKLAAGQPLPLLVETGKQGPELRIAAQVSQLETLARAWRTVLPRQLPVARVLENLVSSTDRATRGNTSPPAEGLRQAVRELVQQLPTRQQISQPDGLRRAIINSGVSLEARLLHASQTGKSPPLTQDFKANLLRVAQSALQAQATSQGSVQPGTSTPSQAGSGNRPVDVYNALLNAGRTSSEDGDTLPGTNRPLLPTLLPATATTTPTTAKTTGAIPQLLQKLLPGLFTTRPEQQPGVHKVTQQQHGNAQLLASLVNEILGQLESGLARIQQHQLASQPGDEAIRHFLNLELPVFNGNTVETVALKIDWAEPGQEEQANSHQWRVVLNFDFEKLGKTQVTVRAMQNEVHTEFRSETTVGREIFASHQALLEEGFRQRGLAPGKFSFATGEINAEPGNLHTENLLETEA